MKKQVMHCLTDVELLKNLKSNTANTCEIHVRKHEKKRNIIKPRLFVSSNSSGMYIYANKCS